MNLHFRKNKLLIALLGIALCVLTTSCFTQKHEKTTLLLDWWPNPNHVPIYAGLEKDIFHKYGIELEILNLQEPPDALIYLLSNRVDVALYYTPHALVGYAKAPNFKIIGKLHDHALYTFMCREDSHIQSIEDFQGKSLGVFGEFLSRAAIHSLEQRGIQLGTLKTVQFEPITMLYTKTLDVISGVYWNIEPFQLKDQGIAVKCFRWEELGLPDFPELSFISSKQFLNKNPTFPRRFQQALHESITYCLQEPKEAFQLYLKHNQKSNGTWEESAWKATCSALAGSQKFDQQRLEVFLQWLEDCKILSKKFNVEDLLDQNL